MHPVYLLQLKTPVLLDTGADLSVKSKAQMDLFVTPFDNTTPRRVHGFGGNSVTAMQVVYQDIGVSARPLFYSYTM